MKKLVVLALLSASVSAADRDQFYAGGNVFLVNNTKLGSGSASIDENNDLGGGVFIGYNLPIHPSVDFGLELEYQRFGNAEFTNNNARVQGDAFYINARPKFIDEGNNLYSALILGVGSMNGETTVSGQSASDSTFSYQAGLEVGYMFDNFDFSVGYRYRTAEFDIADVVIKGVTLGVRYNF
ncbi:porin family protein [Vibrio artabrorum]|uniref:Porin family protein n=1 Tax=Vibrio artabrorum TaxID=446374 RepID=A0ABT8CM83_9VIBR|nr:porin family protein [Vibrio artabrorum]MDN3702465.1 porin family protein [Vibrio artabrorum]